MKATTLDGAFTFEIRSTAGEGFVATVRNRNSGAYDTTGKADEGHEWHFDSLGNAKAWADLHAVRLGAPGPLTWK
jgi:hypothetical protein